MVKTKDIQITKTGNDGVVFYTYTLSSSYDSEKAINFFDNQRRKMSGNIDEEQFITRNIDLDFEANLIFDELSIQEITITDNNKLNAPLNAPFIEQEVNMLEEYKENILKYVTGNLEQQAEVNIPEFEDITSRQNDLKTSLSQYFTGMVTYTAFIPSKDIQNQNLQPGRR